MHAVLVFWIDTPCCPDWHDRRKLGGSQWLILLQIWPWRANDGFETSCNKFHAVAYLEIPWNAWQPLWGCRERRADTSTQIFVHFHFRGRRWLAMPKRVKRLDHLWQMLVHRARSTEKLMHWGFWGRFFIHFIIQPVRLRCVLLVVQ